MEATDLGTFLTEAAADSASLVWFSANLLLTSTNLEVSHSRRRLTGVLGADGIFSFSSPGSLIWARTMGSRAAAPVREALRVLRPVPPPPGPPPGMVRGAVKLFSSLCKLRIIEIS